MPATLPLQSNPHMHLFEAALAGCEVCSESSLWKPLADEIAELALTQFIDAGSGALREFFDARLEAGAGLEGRIVEPGHQFEWAWLLLRWGGEQNPRARAAALKLIEVGEQHGVRNGLALNSLLDDFSPHDARRAPVAADRAAQGGGARGTTHGRSALFHDGRGRGRRRDALPRLPACPGLWHDRIDAAGHRSSMSPRRPAASITWWPRSRSSARWRA